MIGRTWDWSQEGIDIPGYNEPMTHNNHSTPAAVAAPPRFRPTFVAAALLVAANVADLGITYWALRHGGREGNVVMQFVLRYPLLAWWLKILAPTIIAVRIVRDSSHTTWLDKYGPWIAASVSSSVVAWNLLVINGAI